MRRSLSRIAMATLVGGMVVVAGLVMTGRISYVVTSGVSMRPTYLAGDLVLVVDSASYQAGNIVAYHDRGNRMVVMHRVIGGEASGFVLKGDNNQSIDPLRPTTDQIIGRAVLRVPQGGVWLGRINSPFGLALIAFAAIAGGGTAARTRRGTRQARRGRNRATMASTLNPPRRRIASFTTTPFTATSFTVLSTPLRTAAAVIGVAGLLSAGFAALAWAGPVERLVNSQFQTTRSMTFSYSAAVGRTAAYDTTTVTSPDPVFRAVTNTVDVRYAYRGEPGTVAVDAELSTPNGWHSTVPLTAATAFPADNYEGVVRLDLDALSARAAAAANVIGAPAGEFTIVVKPSVTTNNGATFTPTLRLALTPVQLTLTGAAASLLVQEVTADQPVLTARTLGRTGMTVATARTVSVSLALAMLFAVLAFLRTARRTNPTSESARIRRRHKPLLVGVEPMPTPPGRPTVNVTEFQTLVRLAESHGLLILHWTRSGTDTFIVRDEGTTYRYRTESDVAMPTVDTVPTTVDTTRPYPDTHPDEHDDVPAPAGGSA